MLTTDHRTSTRNGQRCWCPRKYTAVCSALTDAPGGSQPPMVAMTRGSSGHATEPPDDGFPSSTMTAQVGRIAHLPNMELNIVKIMPQVNMVNARMSHTSSTGRVSAPMIQSIMAQMVKPPNSE